MKKLLLILPTLLLIGCVNQPQKKVVEVPIYSCPKPIIPSYPDLAIYQITTKSNDSEVLKAYGKSLDQLLLHVDSLTKQLNQYNK